MIQSILYFTTGIAVGMLIFVLIAVSNRTKISIYKTHDGKFLISRGTGLYKEYYDFYLKMWFIKETQECYSNLEHAENTFIRLSKKPIKHSLKSSHLKQVK